MSPMMKKHAKIAASFLCALSLWNCGSDSHDTSATIGKSGTASVALSLAYKAPPLLDSLVLDCYGTDTLHYVRSTDNSSFSMDLFPSDSWKFKAKLYANGALMQLGELETRLEAGTNVDLNIQMHPVVGFVYVEEHMDLIKEAIAVVYNTIGKAASKGALNEASLSRAIKSDMKSFIYQTTKRTPMIIPVILYV